MALETERMADHWRRVLPLPMFDLYHEELVADFEGQARRLIDFIGLDRDPACLRFYETEQAVNTPQHLAGAAADLFVIGRPLAEL